MPMLSLNMPGFFKNFGRLATLATVAVLILGLLSVRSELEGHYMMTCASYTSDVPYDERAECPTALMLAKSSCALGGATECGNLGIILSRGLVFGDEHVASAAAYLDEGCSGGFEPACEELARMRSAR